MGAKGSKLAVESALSSPDFHWLLLGPTGSGKTTVLKQLERLHEHDSSAASIRKHSLVEEKEAYHTSLESPRATVSEVTEAIHRHLIDDFHDLCLYFTGRIEAGDEELLAIEFDDARVLRVVKRLGIAEDWSADTSLSPAIAELIAKLWADTGFKSLFQIRSRSRILDGTEYFFDRVQRIAAIDYKPSFTDYVKLREPTTGVIMRWLPDVATVTDVGGRRGKKWTAAMSGIRYPAVIWVFSLNGYDRVSSENPGVNAYDENWQMFSTICSLKEFESADFIILLNKFDAFTEKLKKVPFSVYNAEVSPADATDPDAVVATVTKRFNQIWSTESPRSSCTRKISFHITCATDSRKMRDVAYVLECWMIQQRLAISGMPLSTYDFGI